MRIPALTSFIILTAIIVATMEPALAAGGFLSSLQGQYADATDLWLATSLAWARNIFMGLIGLEIAWNAIELFFRNQSLDAYIGNLTLRIISIGSAMTILTLAPVMVLPAIQDFINIGATIAAVHGQPSASTPDEIYRSGFKIAQAIMDATKGLGWEQQVSALLPQALGALLVLVSYAVIAGQLLLANIQVMIVVGGAAFLLGFLGCRWTLPFAEKYPAMVIASGIKLVVIVLIAGLGGNLSTRWINIFSGPTSPLDFLSVGASACIYALIAWHIPNYISAMAGASPALNFSSLLAAAAQRGGSSGHGSSREANVERGSDSSSGSGKMGKIERATRTD